MLPWHSCVPRAQLAAMPTRHLLQPPWLLGSAAVEWSHERLLGMVFGFAGAALAAGAYICIRLIGKREHPLTVAM